jgi:hypothetical protein
VTFASEGSTMKKSELTWEWLGVMALKDSHGLVQAVLFLDTPNLEYCTHSEYRAVRIRRGLASETDSNKRRLMREVEKRVRAGWLLRSP